MNTMAPVREFSPASLREARLAAGYSMRDVGRAVGRHEETMADYELGRIAPQADVLAAIAAFLGVDVMAFYPRARRNA